MYFELKVRGKTTRSVRSDVNAQPPKFSAVYHRKFLHGRVYTARLSNLAHHVAPAAFRLYFIVSNSSLVRTRIYIYIYSRFVMNFQRIRPRFLRHVGWNNVAPGKVRSFERLRATLNSSNTAEQFSSAIDDLLPLLYFSKIFRIYRSSTSSFAPLSFFLQPFPFFNFS